MSRRAEFLHWNLDVLSRRYPHGRRRSPRWVAISVEESERRCGESEATATKEEAKQILVEVLTAGTSQKKQKEVDRKGTAVEQIEELERRMQAMEEAPDKEEVRELDSASLNITTVLVPDIENHMC